MPKSCPSAAEVMGDLHLATLTLHGADPSTCEYLFKGNAQAPYVLITFTVATGMTAAEMGSGLKQGQTNVKTLPGLADAAFTFGTPSTGLGLSFLSGGTVCSIVVVVPTTTAAEVALATAILKG